MQVKKQQLEMDMGEFPGGPVAKTLCSRYRGAGFDEAQTGSRLLGEISVISDTQMTPPLKQKVKHN